MRVEGLQGEARERLNTRIMESPIKATAVNYCQLLFFFGLKSVRCSSVVSEWDEMTIEKGLRYFRLPRIVS
jgi:hypothetical protein